MCLCVVFKLKNCDENYHLEKIRRLPEFKVHDSHAEISKFYKYSVLVLF